MLLRAPDVMLLDEPTNHLDIAATEWLENWLAQRPQAMIIVSHDRDFLDRVTNRILELWAGRLTDFTGNFSAYWKQRHERAELLQKTYERQQEYIARTEDYIRKNKMGQTCPGEASRKKLLVWKLSSGRPKLPNWPCISLRRGGPAIGCSTRKTFPKISAGLSFQIFRCALSGAMRSGFLARMVAAKQPCYACSWANCRPTAESRGSARESSSGISTSGSRASTRKRRHRGRPTSGSAGSTPRVLRGLLARFGVGGELALQKVGQMSGGEKSKVALARLNAQNVNVLVLDEPTNHLDLRPRDARGGLAGLRGDARLREPRSLFPRPARPTRCRLRQRGLEVVPGNYSDYVHFANSAYSNWPRRGRHPNRLCSGILPPNQTAGRVRVPSRPNANAGFPIAKSKRLNATSPRKKRPSNSSKRKWPISKSIACPTALGR